MSRIKKIKARQILDSRGNQTIEVDVISENDFIGRAAVPSGASTGKREAVELRDQDPKLYLGKSVLNAVKNVNVQLSSLLINQSIFDQEKIDLMMIEADGTENKSNIGANAILGVSLAVAKLAASEKKQSLYKYLGGKEAITLPIPLMNILNGGAHADNSIDVQEFMIMPVGADTFSEALRMGVEVFHHLKKVLKTKNYTTNVGDEGGFAPNLKSNQEAIETVLIAIEKAGYEPGKDIFIALDPAASEFYNNEEKIYELKWSTGEKLNSAEMVDFWKGWINKYPIASIEDGLAEDDWDGWELMTKEIGERIQLVGDDIFVTNEKIFKEGINRKIGNAILIKVNQIGTLTETIKTIHLGKEYNYASVISHRSGETEDTTIADLAVAMNTGQIKTGSASRSDRIAKYNQLLRIEEELGEKAVYPGKSFIFTNHKVTS